MTAPVPAEKPAELVSPQCRIAYCPDSGYASQTVDGTPLQWCAEVGDAGSEPEFQGWGTDPLSAAMQCAERVYEQLCLEHGESTMRIDSTGQVMRDGVARGTTE